MAKLEFYTPFIGDEEAQEILSFAKQADFTKGTRGGTAHYLPFDDWYGVLYSNVFRTISPENFKNTMNEVWRLFENGKKVAPVVGFARASDGGGVDNVYRKDREKKRDYVFVTHAAGLRLNDLYGYSKPVDKVRERLQGPEAYYNDVVDTFLSILMDSCIRPDISAPNTIYQLVSGFNFVDFNHNNLNTKVNIGQYYKHHVADFLKAFVFSEGNKDSRENKGGRRRRFFPDEQDRQEYRAVAAQELGLLVGKLYKNGISEEHIDYGLKLTGFYDIAKSALQLMC